MIHTEKMTKLRIVAPRSKSSRIINTIHQLNVLHVKKYEELKGAEKGSPLIKAEELSKALLKLRNIMGMCGLESLDEVEFSTFGSLKDFTKKLSTLYEKVSTTKNSIEEKKAELVKIEKKHGIASGLEKIGVDVKKVEELSLLKPYIGTIRNDADLTKLKGSAFKDCTINDGKLIALFSNKNIEKELNEIGYNQINLETYKETTKRKLELERENLKKDISRLEKSFLWLKIQHKAFLLKHEHILEEEIKKAELPLEFSSTKKSFIAQGYVPTKELSKFREGLVSATDGTISIEELTPGDHEDLPVKFDNPKPVDNFEVLMRLYELPKYVEMDPSILLLLTFPFFFGFMLGDVGYGIATMLIFYFVKKKWPDTRKFMNVLMIASVITILFGVAYGEYLGFEHFSEETGERLCGMGLCLHKEILESHGHTKVVYDFPRLLNRGHSTINVGGFELLSVLMIGIIIGAIHINFGLLIGFYNMLKAHGFKHAFLEKFSWFVMEAGVVLTVLTLTGMLRLRMWVGPVVFVISMVLLYLGEGAKGIIEIPAIFSNMLSYVRLGAVGLASLGLAVVVNEQLAAPLFELGGFWIVIAIFVMIIGHLINIALGVLGPFLHGIRLHYVEFFSKFFTGGGEEYKPFGLKNTMEV